MENNTILSSMYKKYLSHTIRHDFLTRDEISQIEEKVDMNLREMVKIQKKTNSEVNKNKSKAGDSVLEKMGKMVSRAFSNEEQYKTVHEYYLRYVEECSALRITEKQSKRLRQKARKIAYVDIKNIKKIVSKYNKNFNLALVCNIDDEIIEEIPKLSHRQITRQERLLITEKQKNSKALEKEFDSILRTKDRKERRFQFGFLTAELIFNSINRNQQYGKLTEELIETMKTALDNAKHKRDYIYQAMSITRKIFLGHDVFQSSIREILREDNNQISEIFLTLLTRLSSSYASFYSEKISLKRDSVLPLPQK